MDIPSYKIGSLNIAPGLVLAPMSGVTSSALRRLIKELNPGAVGLVVTEFISVEALTRNSPRSVDMMRKVKEEHPFAIQIFGYDISRMRDGALMAQDAGADFVDINCGCPVPKVVKRGGGCELMRQPEHLQKIFSEIKKAISIPLTMKMRSGWDSNSLNCLEIAKMAEGEGLAAVAIHGRTRSQLYRGDADWEIIESVAGQVSIPVLGSGDVMCAETARARLYPGGVRGKISGLFIGRGALENPFIFSDILENNPKRKGVKSEVAASMLLRFMDLLLEEMAPKGCIGKIKQLTSQMARGNTWRKPILLSKNLDEQRSILQAAVDGTFSLPASAPAGNSEIAQVAV